MLNVFIYKLSANVKCFIYKANKFPVIVHIDNKSFHENVHSTKQVKEECLRTVIGEIQEMLEKNDVKEIKWIPGEMELANCLTKRGEVLGDRKEVLVAMGLHCKCK